MLSMPVMAEWAAELHLDEVAREADEAEGAAQP